MLQFALVITFSILLRCCEKCRRTSQWNPIRREILNISHLISCTYGISLANEVYVIETVQWVLCEVRNKTCGLSNLHVQESLKPPDLKIEVNGNFSKIM